MRIGKVDLNARIGQAASLVLHDEDGNSRTYRQVGEPCPFDSSHAHHIRCLITGTKIMPPLLEAATFPNELLVDYGHVTEFRFLLEAD